MTSNPYSPPKSETAAAPAPTAAPLYTANGVGIATFLGSILGGGLVIARNFRRLGDHDRANKTLVGSFVGGTVLLVLLMLIPDDLPIPNVVYVIPQILGMRALADSWQGDALKAQESARVAPASNWGAAGFGLLAMLIVAVELVVMVFLWPDSGVTE